MPFLRLSVFEPRPGCELELLDLLEELDSRLSVASGLVYSLVLPDVPGRVAVWDSREDANREAINFDVLSLRSRLRYLSLATDETMQEVVSEDWPRGFEALSALGKEPAKVAVPAAIPG